MKDSSIVLEIVSRQLINYFSSLNKIIFTRGKTKLDYSLDKVKLKNQIGFLNFAKCFNFWKKTWFLSMAIKILTFVFARERE